MTVVDDDGTDVIGVCSLPLTPEILAQIDHCTHQLPRFRNELSNLDRILIQVPEAKWYEPMYSFEDANVPTTYSNVCCIPEPSLIAASALDRVKTIPGEYAYLEINDEGCHLIPTTSPEDSGPNFLYRSKVPNEFLLLARLYWANKAEIPVIFDDLAKVNPPMALFVLKYGLVLPEAGPQSVKKSFTILARGRYYLC